MTLQEKIATIDPDKTNNPVGVRNYINKIVETSTKSESQAMSLIDGLIGKITLERPDAIKSNKISITEAKKKLSKLKTLKRIVPKKADVDKIQAQISKQHPTWDSSKVKALAELRIEAEISRAESFNKMIDTLSQSQFYGAKELSTAQIDKGRSRSLEKDASQTAITEKDEVKKFKRISKRGGKNQFGTTKGGNVYYEYRMNRRDVDNKIRLEKGGGVGIPNAKKMYHLPMEIAIYVPSTKDVSNSITASELRTRVKEVESYLAETFGGFTTSEKVGGYLSSKSSVIREKVVPVTAFATAESFTNNKSKLVNKMSVWAKKWGQEAIGFEFEGDLYYVPQKFKKGGKLIATYIPKRDIKMLTTVWGNNIRGKDLLDGAYTKRKNIKSEPKMARTMFEDEMYEYARGGGILSKYKIIFENENGETEMLITEAYNKAEAMKVGKFMEKQNNQFSRGNYKAQKVEEILDEYGDGGGVHTMPNGEVMLDSAHFDDGGNINLRGGVPKKGSKLLFDLQYGDVFKVTAKNHTASGEYFIFIDLDEAYNVSLKVRPFNLKSENKPYEFINGIKDGEIVILSREEAGAMLLNYQVNNYKFKEGGKSKEPTVVRGYFDDEPYEYGVGGMVEVEDFEALKKGDLISISYSSPISGNNQADLIVKSKTRVLKGKPNEQEKITFTNTANPRGVNFYAYRYLRDNYIGFAIGDLAIWNVKLI